MAHIIKIKNIADERGRMGIIDNKNALPFEVKRILYFSRIKGERGGHAHKKTSQALISIKGSCEIFTNNGRVKQKFYLNSPEKCLILNPEDWHTMQNFSKDAILLALGSEYYDPDDYILEEPK